MQSLENRTFLPNRMFKCNALVINQSEVQLGLKITLNHMKKIDKGLRKSNISYNIKGSLCLIDRSYSV